MTFLEYDLSKYTLEEIVSDVENMYETQNLVMVDAYITKMYMALTKVAVDKGDFDNNDVAECVFEFLRSKQIPRGVNEIIIPPVDNDEICVELSTDVNNVTEDENTFINAERTHVCKVSYIWYEQECEYEWDSA